MLMQQLADFELLPGSCLESGHQASLLALLQRRPNWQAPLRCALQWRLEATSAPQQGAAAGSGALEAVRQRRLERRRVLWAALKYGFAPEQRAWLAPCLPAMAAGARVLPVQVLAAVLAACRAVHQPLPHSPLLVLVEQLAERVPSLAAPQLLTALGGLAAAARLHSRRHATAASTAPLLSQPQRQALLGQLLSKAQQLPPHGFARVLRQLRALRLAPSGLWLHHLSHAMELRLHPAAGLSTHELLGLVAALSAMLAVTPGEQLGGWQLLHSCLCSLEQDPVALAQLPMQQLGRLTVPCLALRAVLPAVPLPAPLQPEALLQRMKQANSAVHPLVAAHAVTAFAVGGDAAALRTHWHVAGALYALGVMPPAVVDAQLGQQLRQLGAAAHAYAERNARRSQMARSMLSRMLAAAPQPPAAPATVFTLPPGQQHQAGRGGRNSGSNLQQQQQPGSSGTGSSRDSLPQVQPGGGHQLLAAMAPKPAVGSLAISALGLRLLQIVRTAAMQGHHLDPAAAGATTTTTAASSSSSSRSSPPGASATGSSEHQRSSAAARTVVLPMLSLALDVHFTSMLRSAAHAERAGGATASVRTSHRVAHSSVVALSGVRAGALGQRVDVKQLPAQLMREALHLRMVRAVSAAASMPPAQVEVPSV